MIICDKCKKTDARHRTIEINQEDIYGYDLCESCFTLLIAALNVCLKRFLNNE